MESIASSFTELVGCVPFWLAFALAIVLGAFDFFWADKYGFRAFCNITFNYRILSVRKKFVDNWQVTMHLITIAALCMPIFIYALYTEYSVLFVFMWWAGFYITTVLTQWFLLIMEFFYFICKQRLFQI